MDEASTTMTRRRQYVAQPGTIPDKVIKYLETLPPGTEMASRPLMEAIGSEVVGGLSNYLVCAVNGGVIRVRPHHDDRRTQLWSLGDGIPVMRLATGSGVDAVAPAIEPRPAPKKQYTKRGPDKAPRKRPSRALAAEASPRAVAALQQRVQLPAPGEGADPVAPDAVPDMRIGLWNTGDLVIERRGEWIEFAAAEVQVLAAYLRDMAVGA